MAIDTVKFSWFQVSDRVKNLLILAAENYGNTSEADRYINEALTEAKTQEEYLDVLVVAYRYFYYKNNYFMALQAANQLIGKIKEAEQLSDCWEQLKPILLTRQESPVIRLYLNAYAASGLVLAKLGQLEQAQTICTQIQEIDHHNQFIGAKILLDILTKPQDDDE
jgi:tetratricopeptide (TPR) repeat protein